MSVQRKFTLGGSSEWMALASKRLETFQELGAEPTSPQLTNLNQFALGRTKRKLS